MKKTFALVLFTAFGTGALIAQMGGPLPKPLLPLPLLIEIITEAGGSIEKAKVANPAFIKLTKAKKSAIRGPVQARLQDDTFLAGLADADLITFDGTTIATA